MKKVKRIMAWVGIIVLLGMYLTTLIMALLATPATGTMFIACIVATIMVPILFYFIQFIYHLIFPSEDES